jgi:hypothetical protein
MTCDSCCILGVSHATVEGILSTMTGTTLVCSGDHLIVIRQAFLCFHDSLEGVSPVVSSLSESLRNPMLESTSTMVLAVNEAQSVFNEVSSFRVGFFNGAYFLPLQEQRQKRVSTTKVQ